MNVEPATGHEVAPGALVMMTWKSGALVQSAPAAAAWNAAAVGETVLPACVDHLGIGQVVLHGVGVFDIAECADGLSCLVGNAFAALGADADRPFDRGILTDLALPLGADLGEIVGPDERGARTVRAVHDGNRGAGQLDAGIELRDRRIVPFRDLAEEDLGDGRAVERQFARLDAGKFISGTTAPLMIGN